MTTTQNPLEQISQTLLAAPDQTPWVVGLVALFALVAGSFFNVVIHRLSLQMQGADPKECSTTKPAKSFCPKCKKTLTWAENIPVVSWVIQLGKCRGCKEPISIQYPLVELASVAIALLCWKNTETLGETIGAILFLDILLLTAVIDAKTKKIPNKLTVPGTAALLGLSFLPGGIEPQAAAIGAAGCFLMMFGMAELGKRLFGKKTITLKSPKEFIWNAGCLQVQDDDNTPAAESEKMQGADLPFNRPSDRIVITGKIEKSIDAKQEHFQKLDTVEIAHDESALIRGHVKSITFPREAMGMGDAKLLLLAGAATGFLPSVHGLVAGTITALVCMIALRVRAIAKKGNPPSLIAFGPWIAAGCAGLWIWTHVLN